MSSVNTSLSLSMHRTHNGTMRNGRGLLSAAKTYTESLFNGKARRKVSYFFFFPIFFFLIFSRESKITPTVVAADATWLLRFRCAAAVTTRSQMKAPQMQFAVTFALDTSQAGHLQEQFIIRYF